MIGTQEAAVLPRGSRIGGIGSGKVKQLEPDAQSCGPVFELKDDKAMIEVAWHEQVWAI